MPLSPPVTSATLPSSLPTPGWRGMKSGAGVISCSSAGIESWDWAGMSTMGVLSWASKGAQVARPAPRARAPEPNVHARRARAFRIYRSGARNASDAAQPSPIAMSEAFPPAAVVSVDTTTSCANLGR